MEESNYRVVTTEEDLRAAVEELSKHQTVGFDSETTSLDPYEGRMRLVQLSLPDGFSYIFDLDRFAENGDARHTPRLQPLRDLLAAPRPVKVAHNCLAGDMLVSMADGTKVRIDELVRTRTRGKVLCIDEKTGTLTTGDIVDWVDGEVRPWDDWLRIRMKGKGRLRVTKDHEILTERGRVRAENLLVGDKVLTSLPELLQPQRDMLYGSLLGDGSLTKQGTAQARTPHFKVSHSLKQEGYVALKTAALDDLVKLVKTEKVHHRGFSNSAGGSQLISLTTKSDPRLFEFYDNCLVGGKRALTSRWLDNLSMPALAVWYCDDGTLAGGSSARICVSALGTEGANRLVEALRSRGFPAKLWIRTDGQLYVKVVGPHGRGMSKELKCFWESIAPYVPVSMQYKLPAAYKHLASDKYWTSPHTQRKAFSDTVVEILPLLNDSSERGRYDGYRRGKRRGIRQYCLAVATHHNFVAGGLAVSNCKFDAKWAKHYLGVELGGVFDTLLASQIVSAGDSDVRHSLERVAARYLNTAVDKAEQLSDWSGELSHSQLEYAARDAAVMLPLREKLVERLKADDLVRCASLEFDCVAAVAQMELTGIYLDRVRWREQLSVVEKRRAKLAEELQDMLAEESMQQSFFGPVREDINLDSHVQLTRALKRLGVPVPDSTRNWKLQPLAVEYPVVATLLDYRTVQKALTSYGENILEEINPHTDRIHANFHQIGAPTGRMSCTNPNIQQVPHAVEYRRCFRAPEGRKLVIADYCVAEGTRVATGRGLVKVEEVKIGDEVCLEDNSRAEVSAVIARGKLPVKKVTLRNGYSITATSLHRIRVLDAAGDYVWRRIAELQPGDRVAVQPERGLHEGLPYDPLPETTRTHFNNKKNLTTPPLADEQLALFAGYVTGDGTFRENGIGWVVNSQDSDVARTLEASATELFGVEVHERGVYRGVIDSAIHSVPLAKWFAAIGVSKSSLPEFLWRGRPSVAAAYLRGLFEADGSVTDSATGKVSFSSSRGRLAAEVHRLLLALGIPATLRRQQNTGPRKRFECWHVSVLASGLENYRRQVGFISARKQAKLASLVARWTGKTVVGNMPNLRQKVRGLALSGEPRQLLNNTASLGRSVSAALASTLEATYPEVAGRLGLKRITRHRQMFLPVISVEDAGDARVFDLSVPGPMTYISDGFVSHNSQIELRILADFTGDQGFIDAFNSGADLHRVTAAQIFGVPLENVTKEQRDFAKRLNFGVVYGIGAQRFSMMTGLKLTEAEDILRRYFATYRALDAWLRKSAQQAVRERQAPRTVAGRLARFNFDPEDKQAVSLAQRNGKNSPIQGCVNAGTRIFEKTKGYIPIESLVGEKVCVWDGSRFSNARVAYSGKKQLVRVTLWGGHYIECSPDHKFLTTDVNGRRKWRTPAEFVKGCWVVLTDAVPVWNCELKFPPFEAGKSHNASRASLSDMSAPVDLGVWLGRLASDGSLGERQLDLLVAEHEEMLLPEIKRLCGEFGHVSYRVGRGGRGPRRMHDLTISALGLCRQLNSAGVKTRVPDFAWQSADLLAGYLRGMFDGDGTVTPDGPALCFGQGGRHLGWAREIQQALLLLGIRSRINVCADRINVCVLKRDSALFARRIGFMNPGKQAKVEAVTSSQSDGKIYGRAARIKSVESTGEFVDMYDVVDSDTEQFMANGLVTHNSSADIIKRSLRLLHDQLKETSTRIVNVVHDEIVVETPAEEAEATAKTVEDAMCRAGEEYVRKVPVKVESQIADEWVK